MPRSIDEYLEWGAAQLREIAERPRKEAEILLGHALAKERLYLITHLDEMVLSPEYEGFITRRASSEPIEYITNVVSFFSQEFYAAPGALIARPETEILIERLLEKVDKESCENIVEVGVGSGVISIILAQHLETAHFIASDISEAALAVARKNIEDKGLKERITLVHTSLLDGINQPIDILVSNPPYIADAVELEAPLGYEPQNALYGGESGDELLQEIIALAFEKNVRILACEMGYDQKDKIAKTLEGHSFKNIEFYSDYEGHDRGFILEMR